MDHLKVELLFGEANDLDVEGEHVWELDDHLPTLLCLCVCVSERGEG